MRTILCTVFAGLAVLTALAMFTRPVTPQDGKTGLLRTSDYHPRRALELATFNRLHPGLRLSLDPNDGSNVEKIIVQVSSGVGPDLFDVWGGEYLQTYVEAGVAWDVTAQAKTHGFSMDDKAWPAVRGNISYEGRQYSYPANCGVDILIYNKAIFDEMGVPYPQPDMTWDETFALAQRVTRPRTATQDLYFGLGGASWQYFFESQHGEFFSDDLTRLQITRGALPIAFQMHKDMIFKYKVSPSTVDLKAMSGQGGFGSGQALGEFSDGRFAMIAIGKWALVDFRAAYKDEIERAGNDPAKLAQVIRLGSVHLPHMAGKKPVYRIYARSTAINVLGPNREKALTFLSYLAGPEYSAIVNEGVDALPGNPAYADYGLQPGTPALAELEMHRNTVESMQYGYLPKESPFLLSRDVYTVVKDQISRVEADPELPVMTELKDAEDQLLTLMQRNLDRDPGLAAKYKALTGTTDVRKAQDRK
jgi:ABC-type glycerol-3-phosphate transport system substrate-binding protein